MGIISICGKENGRQNPKTAAQTVVDEEQEIDRWQVNHHLTKSIFNGNFSAPIEQSLRKGIRVLDVGCGYGTWLFDCASEFTKSEFFGVDIAQNYPSNLPFNVNIRRGNVLRRLPFQDNAFHFVNMRFFLRWFTHQQWADIAIPELIRVLKPGCWLELLEIDYMLANPGPILAKYLNKGIKKFEQGGLDPRVVLHLENFMNSTGQLSAIHSVKHQIPLGPRHGIINEMVAKNFFSILLNFLVSLKKISQKEKEKLMNQLLAEVDNADPPTQITYYRFFGQKV